MNSPFTDPDALEEQYKTQDHLAVRIATHQNYTVPNLDLPLAGVDLLPWRGDELVIDVGCGNGAYHEVVTARTGRYIAADYSLGMLTSIEPVPTSPVNLDAQALPIRDQCADIILANHMLYHVPDKPRALAEFKRVLKPGGYLLAATNSDTTMSAFRDIMLGTAASLGVEITFPDWFGGIDFTLENGFDYLEEFFGYKQRHTFRNALVFTEAKPIVDYQMSMWGGLVQQITGGLTAGEFAAGMFRYLEQQFAQQSEIKVHKTTGFFICQ